MRKKAWGTAALSIGLVATLAGCASGGGSDTGGGAAPQKLTVLIGSSGDAETAAVQAAADAWGTENDTEVEVIAASDLNQQLAQGFAGDDAPDLFYMGWDQFQTFAGQRFLEPYAADLSNAGDYYPELIDTFSSEDEFICAPKDFSTLGLIINTDAWAAAGLTEADVPTDWAGLEAAATKLTTGDQVGLSFGLEYARAGAFMNQAGGEVVSEDGTKVTLDSKENVAGLEFIKKLHDAGVYKTPAEIDAGWSGEALGQGKAAMVIEGPWIKGIKGDFPDRKYLPYELPAGPGGKSTFTFSNCWGIPQGAETAEAAASLVEFLTTDEQQLAFAEAFGVIPSTESAAATYAETYPENASFVAGAEYAVSPVNFAGSASAITDFNSKLETLFTGDAASILSDSQVTLQAALDEANG